VGAGRAQWTVSAMRRTHARTHARTHERTHARTHARTHDEAACIHTRSRTHTHTQPHAHAPSTCSRTKTNAPQRHAQAQAHATRSRPQRHAHAKAHATRSTRPHDHTHSYIAAYTRKWTRTRTWTRVAMHAWRVSAGRLQGPSHREQPVSAAAWPGVKGRAWILLASRFKDRGESVSARLRSLMARVPGLVASPRAQ
jgi:hypothetical protein